MEGKPRRAALVFLVAFVAVAAGSPACPRPSVVDTILGRPDSCWDSDSTLPLGVYQIGVVEGDEATLQKASSMVQKNREDYVALLFYASWCPFSKICHPNFQILSNLFPTIRHFAFEESVIRPSILSRYGVHGFPTLFLLNSTMRVQYHGSRTRNSLAAFYNHVTGVGPSPKLVFLDNVMDPPDDTELKEDTQENCPFSWARSPEKLLQQDGYLALASGFLLMRLLYFLLPRLNACFQRAWRRQIRYVNMRNLWNYFQACTEQAKREGSRLHPCERHHLQEGAMSARAWASQSLASVTLGEPSSGRAYSTGREKLGQDAAGWL